MTSTPARNSGFGEADLEAVPPDALAELGWQPLDVKSIAPGSNERST